VRFVTTPRCVELRLRTQPSTSSEPAALRRAQRRRKTGSVAEGWEGRVAVLLILSPRLLGAFPVHRSAF